MVHVDQVILHHLLLAVEILGLQVELGAVDEGLGGGQTHDLALNDPGPVALGQGKMPQTTNKAITKPKIRFLLTSKSLELW